MKFLFLMDPLNTVKMEKDTSFILMLGACRKGHTVYYLPDGGVRLINGKVHFRVIPVIPQEVKEKPFIVHEPIELGQNDVDAVFVRSDPPFDEAYLTNTWLLERLPKRIAIINSPSGIRTVNEKIWVTQFTSITPKTLVSRHKGDIRKFFAIEKEIVVKPINGYGGSAIFYVRRGDKNANVIFEIATQQWTKDIILQKYIPEAKNGDKRILLLNGEVLGCVLRVHAKDDHRNNFFAGGHPEKTTVTPHDRKIIKILKPHLKQLGLYFVGLDIIGRYLIEINVTSPTCLQEMNRLYNRRLEVKVIDFVEKSVNRNK